MTGGRVVLAALGGALALAAAPAQAQTPRQVLEPGGSGAFPAVAEAHASAPGFTVYRPLRAAGAKLPIVLWGNGGCRDAGLSAAAFLREIASHGYLVIANGAPRGFPALPPGTPPPPPPAVDETRAAALLEALDWAARDPALRRLGDQRRVAVMGHSCGGLQALAVGHDPRIDTVVLLGSGVYNRPGSGVSRVSVSKDDLRKIKVPMAYFLGGESDIAFANGRDDVARIDHVPVFLGSLPVGHGGTLNVANGGDWARAATAWLDWQLKGSRAAARWFAGSDCRLCTTYGWTVTAKNIMEPK